MPERKGGDGGMVLSGGALKAAILAAESPLLRGAVRGRFLDGLGISAVLDLDVSALDPEVRPATLPWIPQAAPEGGAGSGPATGEGGR